MEVLQRLKALQLRRLAGLCGTPRSGTKASLINGLLMKSSEPFRLSRQTRIVSIDMGLRNIALCKSIYDGVENAHRVTDWTVSPLDGWDNPGAFDQPQFAGLAKTFMETKILNGPQPVDVLLIEKQRLRSAGGRSVNEVIAQINMLEAMFHALALTHPASPKILESVSPAQVTMFWTESELNQVSKLERHNPVEKLTAGQRYKQTKKLKEALGASLINDSASRLEFEPGVLVDAQATAVKLKKQDDLADALLQAVAWTRWVHNRHRLNKALFSENASVKIEESFPSIL